jgi:hypothetical protein
VVSQGSLRAHPQLGWSVTFLPYDVTQSRANTHPELRWDAHPPANLACLVPSTTAHTPACLAFCGVSVTSHTPYWECDRGYRHTQVMTTGIRVSTDSSFYASNNCAKLSKPETPQFLWVILNRPFWTSWTFWTSLDNVQDVQNGPIGKLRPRTKFILLLDAVLQPTRRVTSTQFPPLPGRSCDFHPRSGN